MRLAQILFTQGFGTRRECAALLARGEVSLAGRVLADPDEDIPTNGLVLEVRGAGWPYRAPALVLLNKPAGYECSRQPGQHPGVLSLLPAPLQRRGVQPVGRLDVDTTGLLLLTDDGDLIHRLTHPRRHVTKVYQVGTRHAVGDDQITRLLAGVVLHDDPHPVRAAACERTGECSLRLTLTDGRYHQVKRLLAAVGNRVETLHRTDFGGLALPPGLAPGAWCWIDAAGAFTAGPGTEAAPP
jgi:16S rRNA pseudouridine516 synthase